MSGKLLNFLAIVVLVAGIIAGVDLAQTSQDIRERAAPEGKVSICHKTGSESNPWNQIEINENAVDAHLGHGDMLSECPKPEPSDEPAPSEEPAPSQEPTNEPTTNPTSEPTQAPTANPTTQPTSPSSTQTPTDNGGGTGGTTTNTTNNTTNNQTTNTTTTTTSTTTTKNTFNQTFKNEFKFTIRIPEITGLGSQRNVTIEFRKDGRSVAIRNVTISPLQGGVFAGTIEGVEAGTYDVWVKVDYYLSRLFEGVQVISGTNSWNWSTSKLTPGDFNNDNVLNIYDAALFLAEYVRPNITVNTENDKFDLDGNRVINMRDLNIFLINFTRLNIKGDE